MFLFGLRLKQERQWELYLEPVSVKGIRECESLSLVLHRNIPKMRGEKMPRDGVCCTLVVSSNEGLIPALEQC